jgi:hypothetical protein
MSRDPEGSESATPGGGAVTGCAVEASMGRMTFVTGFARAERPSAAAGGGVSPASKVCLGPRSPSRGDGTDGPAPLRSAAAVAARLQRPGAPGIAGPRA